MTKLPLWLGITLLFCQAAISQSTKPAPTPPVPQATPDPNEAARRTQQNRQMVSRFEMVRGKGFQGIDRARLLQVFQQHVKELYRKPSGDELALLKPDSDVAVYFQDFLRKARTGLFKLIPDQGCSENTKVIVASEHCIKYSMPGSGSSYSFRTDSHRIPRLSDLTFSNGQFRTVGVLVQGILVDIGNERLDGVSLESKGMKFLRDFQTTSDFREAVKIDLDFVSGIESGGFVYKRVLDARENTTYLLRSAAYRGPMYRSYEGVTYDEFDFDKRRDIIVAFRIVEKGVDGSLTILWRELETRKAPSVDWPDNDDEEDVKNKFAAGNVLKN